MTTSADYAGLGPCVQDPAWVKMNSPTPALQKKRKKSGSKPHSQINKCLNEKRRRKQENAYFEELAELLQANFASDMNSSSLSSKTDKTAILLQTFNEIKKITEKEDSEGAVQQGEVSSSKQTVFEKHLLANFVLEALDGFLFLLTPERKIELVSENVAQYIKYTPEDLVGQDIFNIIHVGDTANFSSAFVKPLGWASDSTSSTETPSRSRMFICRLLVKQPDDKEEAMDEKQQRPHYESMQISTVLTSSHFGDRSEGDDSPEGEGQQHLLCIARRTPVNENVQQFSTKLDAHSTILEIDHSGLTGSYAQYINKDLLLHKRFSELCHPDDLSKFNRVMQEVPLSGLATSDFRLKLGSDLIVHIQSKFKYVSGLDESFFMVTHSIVSSSQDGGSNTSTTTTSLIDEALGSCISRTGCNDLAPLEANRQPRRRMLTPNNNGTPELGLDNELSSEGQSQPQQNKILKGLLDQKSDDEDQTMSPTSALLGRLCPPNVMQPQQQMMANSLNHLDVPIKNSSGSNANQLLKDLLKDDEDEKRMKLEPDDPHFGLFRDGKTSIKQEVLQPWENEDKGAKTDSRSWADIKDVNVKSEFRLCVTSTSPLGTSMPMGVSPSSPSNSVGTPLSSTSPSYSLLKSTSPFTPFSSSSQPPATSSTELHSGLTPNIIRGTKRPSDEGHNGNPNKFSFGALLADSPPMTSSPNSGPLQRPNTPQTHPTPIGLNNANIGRPNTPLNSGRPATPHGPTTPSMAQNPMGSLHVGPPVPSSIGQGCGLSPSAVGLSQCRAPSTSPTLSVSQQQRYQHLQQQPPSAQPPKKNELLLQLLEAHSDSAPDPNKIPSKIVSPYAKPSENLKQKNMLSPRQWSTSISQNTSSASSVVNNPTSDILNQLLREKSPRPIKINNTVMTSHMVHGDQLQQNQDPLLPQVVPQQSPFQQRQQQQQQSTLTIQNPQLVQSTLQQKQPYSQGQQLMQQQQQQQQQRLQIQMSIGGNIPNNPSLSNAASPLSNLVSIKSTPASVPSSLFETGQTTDISRMIVSSGSANSLGLSSMSSSSTTTTLPSFIHSMAPYLPPNAAVSSSNSCPDGQLPSIIPAPGPSFSNNHFNAGVPPEIIQVILDIDAEVGGESSSPGSKNNVNSVLEDFHSVPSSSSLEESVAIQEIHRELMKSELETHVPVSEANYPPPYNNINNQRGRFPSPGPSNLNAPIGNNNPAMSIGSNPVLRHSGVHYAPGSPIHTRPSMGIPQQRVAQLSPHHSEQMKFRLQQRQQQPPQQLHIPSSNAEVVQAPPPSYQQNLDDLINPNVVSNPQGVGLQRSMSESQSSPNYGLINSPLGNGATAGQVSPGGRIPQPSFSPHGQLTSPLSSNPQFSNNTNIGQIGNYQNVQNSQLSPSLSQNSPVGASYPSGGSALLPPQMSPTAQGGQVASGPQSPAWSGSSPQHRPSMQQQTPQQQQNTILNAQFNVMSPGSRSFTGGVRPNTLPSIRALPNSGSRQAPYTISSGSGHNPGGGQEVNVFAPSAQQGSMMLHQQQQQQPQQAQQLQQQYRLNRTISAPSQLTPGMPSPRSTPYPHHPGAHHHHHASHTLGGPFSPLHNSPGAMASGPHMGGHNPMGHHGGLVGPPSGNVMGQIGGSIDGTGGPPSMMGVMGNQHMMGTNAMSGALGPSSGMVSGMMGPSGFGDVLPPQPQNFEGGSPCFGAGDGGRNPSGTSGSVSDHTRNQLRARVESHSTSAGGGNGLGRSGSPSSLLQSQQTIHQLQQPQGQRLIHGGMQRSQMQQQQLTAGLIRQQQQQQQLPQQAQQQANYQSIDPHQQHLDQNLLHSLSSPEGSNWGRENLGGVPQGNHSGLSPSPRIEDGRGSATGAKEDKSMLKKLLSQ